MPRPRFLRLPDETRATLLRLATKQFAERGYEGASLNEILADAGLSKGSYYYYFEDKEDLYATVVESAAQGIFSRLGEPDFSKATRRNYWPTVEKFVGRWVDATDSPLELFQMSLHLADAQRSLPRLDGVLSKMRAHFRVLIAAGQRVGCVREDLPLEVLVELVEGADKAIDHLFARRGKVTRADIDSHSHLVFDTLKRILERHA